MTTTTHNPVRRWVGGILSILLVTVVFIVPFIFIFLTASKNKTESIQVSWDRVDDLTRRIRVRMPASVKVELGPAARDVSERIVTDTRELTFEQVSPLPGAYNRPTPVKGTTTR